jgi:hypothetical protein
MFGSDMLQQGIDALGNLFICIVEVRQVIDSDLMDELALHGIAHLITGMLLCLTDVPLVQLPQTSGKANQQGAE